MQVVETMVNNVHEYWYIRSLATNLAGDPGTRQYWYIRSLHPLYINTMYIYIYIYNIYIYIYTSYSCSKINICYIDYVYIYIYVSITRSVVISFTCTPCSRRLLGTDRRRRSTILYYSIV